MDAEWIVPRSGRRTIMHGRDKSGLYRSAAKMKARDAGQISTLVLIWPVKSLTFVLNMFILVIEQIY